MDGLLFILSIMVPLIMIIWGFLIYFKPPKKINDYYGFRSKTSKSSLSLWQQGNSLSGKAFILVGFILLIPSISIPIIFKNLNYQSLTIIILIMIFLETLILLLTLLRVEMKLRKALKNEKIK